MTLAGSESVPAAQPAEPPERHQVLRQRGERRLKSLTDRAEEDSFYGTVSVELTFQQGRITLVRHTVIGTDRS